jgi:signal transduction histidine kinase
MNMCETQIRMADLNAMIRDFERLFRSVIGQNVLLRTTLDPKLGQIQSDPSKIGSLVVNLLMHAREATPAGGEISVATLNADLDESTAGEMHLSPGAYVLMDLGVSGQMDAPAKVREIIQEVGGAVSIRAIGSQGSSLTIVLPRVTTDAAALS